MNLESQRNVPKNEKRAKPHPDAQSPEEIIELSDADIETVEGAEGSPDVRETPEAAREREMRARQPLLDALRTKGLDAQSSLELIAAYDSSLLEDKDFRQEVDVIASSYGVKLDGLSQVDRDKIAVMYLGIKNGRMHESKEHIADVLETGMRDQLVGQAFRNFDAARSELDLEKPDAEKLQSQLTDVMATLNALSKQIPREQEGSEKIWRDISSRFNGLVEMKRAGGAINPEVNKAFTKIFEQFSDFIEDDIVALRLKKGGEGVEEVMHDIYGRSPEEIEKVKERNREAVAEAIKKMAEAPTIELSMIEELHAINNKGIVPKNYSKLRDDANRIVTFNKRIGLLVADVRPEMEKMLERANDLYDASIVKNMSKLRYEVEAAKLHNDLLDMHPFGDRNGSTSLLFLELMMAKKGYEPPKTREKDYYKNLAGIVGYNPVAVAIVGHEQYKIANEVGYYGQEAVTGEKKVLYDAILNAYQGMKKKGGKKK